MADSYRLYDISSNLTLGNRNFVPEVTFVQKLYDWDGLSKPIKNLCRTTKFVHLIGCQGGNNFWAIWKNQSDSQSSERILSPDTNF